MMQYLTERPVDCVSLGLRKICQSINNGRNSS